MKRLKLYAKWLSMLIKYLTAYIISPVVKRQKKYKDLWLFSERGQDARDNGYHLFKYVRQNVPEQNTAYIISKNSADKEKIEALGDTIEFNSFSHYLAIICAKVRISTHILGYTPDTWFFTKLDKLGLVPHPQVYLQHGVTKDDASGFHREVAGPDIFITSAPRETDYAIKQFNQPSEVVKEVGMCRYDNLKKSAELTNNILLMPTWRQSLYTATNEEFLKSDYFATYQELINDKALDDLLKKYNKKLLFYPHFEVQKYINSFTTDIENVKICSFENSDVQQLFLSTDMLITDYSSVFFDMAYMEKPTIFYHFDYEAFRASHYQEGYFSYEKDGFGKVCKTKDELLAELELIIENGSKMADEYKNRSTGFFAFSDNNNCERTYNEIVKLLNK